MVLQHPEFMLSGLLYWSADISDPNSSLRPVRNKNREHPFIDALIQGGDASIEVIRDSGFLRLPTSLASIESLAFVLHEILDHEGARKLAQMKIRESEGYELENWSKLLAAINHPEIATGKFVYGNEASYLQVNRARKELQEWQSKTDRDDYNSILMMHYKIKKIFEALIKYKNANNSFPEKLSDLTNNDLLDKDALVFVDRNKVKPLLLYKAPGDKNLQDDAIISIRILDGKYMLEAFLNGEIVVSEL